MSLSACYMNLISVTLTVNLKMKFYCRKPEFCEESCGKHIFPSSHQNR